MTFIRKYVGVMAEFTNDGRLLPREIIWEDGRKFDIEKIVSAKKSVLLKTGGIGIQYSCLIKGFEKHLFYDNYKWFVECAA